MGTSPNETHNRPPLSWSVFLALLGILGGYAFFFSALIAVKTAVMALNDHIVVNAIWARPGLKGAVGLGPWFTPILTVTGVLSLSVLLRFLKPKLLRRLVWVLALWTFGLLLASVYLYNCSMAGQLRIGLAHKLDETLYSSTLHRLLLIEAAENRLDSLRTELGDSFDSLLVVETDPSNIPKQKLHSHLRLLYSLAKTENSSYRKRALASLPGLGWRPEDRTDLRLTKKFLKAAQDITSEEHTSFKALVDWIEPKLNTDGWDPIPIAYLDLDSLKESIKE